MIDHEFGRNQGIDPLGPPADFRQGIPHRGQVHHTGNTGEVLQQDAPRPEGDLTIGRIAWTPTRQRFNIIGGNRHSILVAEHPFQQDLEGKRESTHSSHPLLEGFQTEKIEFSTARFSGKI